MNVLFMVSALFVLHFSQIAQAVEARYYGSNNQEATFTIQAYTFFAQSPSESTIQNDVRNKAKFILGYMQRTPGNRSSLNGNFKITTLKIEAAGAKFRVLYQITGKGVFRPNNTQYTFVIPIIHGSLYAKSQGLCTRHKSETTESNFWYYWDPFVKDCPLVENADFLRWTTALTYKPNTIQTFPEYARLFSNGQMTISSFFGVANYDETNWNPDTTKDIAGGDFKHQRDELTHRYGMSARVWSETEVRQVYNPAAARPIPYIEEFTKATARGVVKVQLFFGNTGLNHDSRGFHLFLNTALASNQVVIYNGHSGLGQNLNLVGIESDLGHAIKLNPSYQIYFLGSCVPYAYYTDMFFKRKSTPVDPNGTKNLDLISFGVESVFGNHYDDRLLAALFDFADNNHKQSYQQLIGDNTDYLFGINGDEDNPILP